MALWFCTMYGAWSLAKPFLKLGWVLDAMDFLLYVMALGHLKAYFGFDDGTDDSRAVSAGGHGSLMPEAR